MLVVDEELFKKHSQVPPRRTSSCPAPDGSGTRTPLTTRRSSPALCPEVRQPESQSKGTSHCDVSLCVTVTPMSTGDGCLTS